MPRLSSASWRWGAVVAYMALIFAFSSITQPPALPGNTDKPVHALLYAGLGALLVRALAGGWGRHVRWATAVAAVVLACLYGVSDEYHQSFVPNRQSDVRDVIADTVGAAFAVAACGLWAGGAGRTGESRSV